MRGNGWAVSQWAVVMFPVMHPPRSSQWAKAIGLTDYSHSPIPRIQSQSFKTDQIQAKICCSGNFVRNLNRLSN